jgi:hypothetical protein
MNTFEGTIPSSLVGLHYNLLLLAVTFLGLDAGEEITAY